MHKLALALLAASLQSQTPSVHDEVFHGRQAYVLQNGAIRVSALRGGGHLAEIRFDTKDPERGVNPMRVPHYQTIEPYQYDPARHDALYGDSPHRWLSSGYMGHLLCFPSFGPPSSEQEVRAGLGNHGEAPIVEWHRKKVETGKGSVTLWYAAELPKTQYRVERAVTMVAGESVVYVDEWVENLASFDRPVNWVQHATFGPPFAEPGRMFLDVSATKGEVGQGRPGTNSLTPGTPVEWPEGTSRDGKRVNLRSFQTPPHTGTYYAMMLDRTRPQSYFTMYNDKLPVLIGYVFPTADNPWIGDWQENQNNDGKPWDRKAIARGMEFGSTPFAEGLRKSVERGSMFGAPSYRWIGARERLKTRFVVFLAGIPKGFPGVANVRLESGAIQVEARGSKQTITVKASKL